VSRFVADAIAASSLDNPSALFNQNARSTGSGQGWHAVGIIDLVESHEYR